MSEQKFIVFLLANERYGIPIDAVERILPEQKPTPIPKSPEMFLGVFDLRGETIPAIDLRVRFSFPEWDGEGSNYIVIRTETGKCAIKVDAVAGIVMFDSDDIDEAAEMLKDRNDDFLSGVGKDDERLVVLLEPNHILPADVRERILSQGKESSDFAA
ncbi:MAG: purine-binding chemotaxis protein CheW [Armatimonadetes bacterium]|nr:purine-binding chemotaxis protein CheW [Armatimonadota bacterium]